MENSKKRPRPTLSCRQCRQKKLRCDRTHPCQQCVKGQRETLCVFDKEFSSPQAAEPQRNGGQVSRNVRIRLGPDPSSPALQEKDSIIEDLQARVTSLEAIISASGSSSDKSHKSAQPPVGILSRKGNRCRYYGNGYQSGLFDRVQGTATSILQPSVDPDLWSLAKHVQELMKAQPSSKTSSLESERNEILQLREKLPAEDVCDALVQTYFDMYEETLVILHRPTFMPLYSDFMENRADLAQSCSGVEAQVYAAMGLAAYHLQFSGNPHQQAAKQWLSHHPFIAIDTWLDSLSRKSRAEISVLQTRALSVLSQQARGRPAEEHWQATNALVRAAMVLGLHRDPRQFKPIPPLQADLRRRLWWSIVEMDMWASLSYGMPTAVCPEDTDCMPGIRADDLDLGVYLSGSPTGDLRFTVQNFFGSSLRSRLDIVNILSRARDESSRVRLRELWEDVQDAMGYFPKLVDSGMAAMNPRLKSAAVSLKSFHNVLLLSLQRFLTAEDIPNDECAQGAADILSSLIHLAPEGEERNPLRPYLSKFLVEFTHAIYKAVALICMRLDHFTSNSTDSSLDTAELFQILESFLQVFVESVPLERESLKNILALSISTSLSKARSSGEEEKDIVRKGLKETLTSLRGRLSDSTEVSVIYMLHKLFAVTYNLLRMVSSGSL